MPPALEYETMKNSGIEWIGAVPSHWNIRTLYQLVSQVKNKNSDLAEQNLLSLSYGKIKRKDINSTDGLLPASFDGYNIIEAGDIVLRLTDLQNDKASLRVGLATERGIITSAYITLRPFDVKQSKYLYYLLHTFDIKKGFYGMGSGVRQGLNYGGVKELRIALPSQDEIEAVASYLDVKCVKIDEVILETKASIEDYKRLRTSIIFEATTKGIDPSLKMKNSNVEWIGKTPCEWEIVRIKNHYRIIGGNGFSLDLQGNTSGDLPFCKASDISASGGRMDSAANYVSYDTAKKNKFNIIPQGSIVFAKIGEAMKKNNRAICLKPCCIDNNCQAVVPNEMDSIYSYYLFSCIDMSWFDNAGTIPSINNTKLLNCYFARPPIDEQKVIVDYLENKCSEIDSIISTKQMLIESLNEYKQSLIYEVVTGKRKVCNS